MHQLSKIFVVLLVSNVVVQAADRRRVDVVLTGGEKKSPLIDLQVKVITRAGAPYTEVAKGQTDRNSSLSVNLVPGRYQLRLTSEKELRYLPIARGYKWSDPGYQLVFDVKDKPEAQQVAFALEEACELSLRAIDVETGAGLPGASFCTACDSCEVWAIPINGDNLGAKKVDDLDHNSLRTGKDGSFLRLLGPHEGYTYCVWKSPSGYQLTEPNEDIEIDTSLGRKGAEHVFKFRRVK